MSHFYPIVQVDEVYISLLVYFQPLIVLMTFDFTGNNLFYHLHNKNCK